MEDVFVSGEQIVGRNVRGEKKEDCEENIAEL